jgi:hypothetical protein
VVARAAAVRHALRHVVLANGHVRGHGRKRSAVEEYVVQVQPVPAAGDAVVSASSSHARGLVCFYSAESMLMGSPRLGPGSAAEEEVFQALQPCRRRQWQVSIDQHIH